MVTPRAQRLHLFKRKMLLKKQYLSLKSRLCSESASSSNDVNRMSKLVPFIKMAER